jgi:hypothetical protein
MTTFSHYEPVPGHVTDKLVADAKRQKEEAESHRA